MASPFPGMDPYLEGDLWPDVHHALASQIRRQLMPLIQPKYVARISRYVVEDNAPESEIGIMYPDVEVLLGRSAGAVSEPSVAYSTGSTPLPPSLSVPIFAPVEVRIPVVEIRDSTDNLLITAIEILSPVNKREPGLNQYLQKRRRLHQSGIHFLEIDLLRRGTRPVQHPKLEKTPYLIALTRAHQAQTDIWPVGLRSPLPVVPVPLAAPDQDVPLDLQHALREVYKDAAYHLSIDYSAAPPPPKLEAEDAAWAQGLKPV
ncbi:MAG: DUF4058 family protein [Saprospiraceae bacterium]|nr:DUF4058 family protein [Saprospiraceae bacterium]